jgi:putative heme iron utilization protein
MIAVSSLLRNRKKQHQKNFSANPQSSDMATENEPTHKGRYGIVSDSVPLIVES